MAHTVHYHTKLEASKFYHVYNRSVDRMPLFKNEGNYQFFLKKYTYYLSDVVDTYAYCLLGNHFHFLVRVPDLPALANLDLSTFKKLTNLSTNQEEINIHDIVSHQFRKFFQSYALAFNKQQNRTGTLFQTPFKRALVDTDQYYTRLVYYIHANPQLHGLIDDFRDWKWSSYGSILSDKPSKLKKQQVIDWFGSIGRYKAFHAENQQLINSDRYILEDD